MNARPDPASIFSAPSQTLPRRASRSALPLSASGSASGHPGETLPCHKARQLTCGGSLAQIDLDGQIYALRITRAGKLTLTK